ncbi:hypothetical protein Celal_1447 [Cellulophaga algicola DSM 14237]|uniref:DUF4236 domain-containing protein n=1 Tax=Cellulophaga algicola (strain DSM 14237 / IC166 / ACAM 630) TaxID=688270 RepID=E6X9K9_CELAD|nr:DUF4236 domain-containing protein [Cellulophaga algicola]ADV48759.1 hypothetical protein Celal_1447 [Cellulophaga algicola DSM 14237]
MRYRNRIKLAPGLNINLSKSGISTTFGPKGASVNIGKSGAYLNTGIPGTGLYNRTKISSSGKNLNTKNYVSKTQVGVKLDLNENYEPEVQIYDNNGKNITSQEYITKLKRTVEYKENLKKIYLKYHDLIIEETAEFTDLFKHIIKPITKKNVQSKLNKLNLRRYDKQKFEILKPSESSIEQKLISEAKIKFNSVLFWKNKSSRNEFVKNNLDLRLRKSIKDWEIKKVNFEKSEQAKEIDNNANYLKAFEQEKENLQANLDATENFVLANFETILKEIDIKPEFFIDYDYDFKTKTFLVDLDLPEIEHLPKETASILQSGKLSVKNKTEKQQREEYAKCVTGLGLLVSGISFMASAGIEFIKISAYTQRVDKKDGNTKDDYIYSIELDREKFSNLKYDKIDPIRAFENFTHKMELSKTSIFKTIVV